MTFRFPLSLFHSFIVSLFLSPIFSSSFVKVWDGKTLTLEPWKSSLQSCLGMAMISDTVRFLRIIVVFLFLRRTLLPFFYCYFFFVFMLLPSVRVEERKMRHVLFPSSPSPSSLGIQELPRVPKLFEQLLHAYREYSCMNESEQNMLTSTFQGFFFQLCTLIQNKDQEGSVCYDLFFLV